MRVAKPLPEGTPDSFSVGDARARGISRSRLHRSDLLIPFRGVRTRADARDEGTLLAACLRYAPRLRPWQFFSHETVFAVIGAPLPRWPYQAAIHVSAHRPAREPRIPGVTGHRLQVRQSAVVPGPEGIPLEHPVRAWRQTATLWRYDELVAVGDYLVSGDDPIASIADLRDEVETMGDVGGGILRRSLLDVRVGVRSPEETRLRLVLGRAGLPEPRVNWVLRDDGQRFIAELDLAYPRWRVATEYDGRVHETDPNQFAKDTERWERIRAAGWEHVRIMRHHMRGDGSEAVKRVARALTTAGWTPRS